MGKRRSTKKQAFVTRRIPVRQAVINSERRKKEQKLKEAHHVKTIDRKRRVLCGGRHKYRNLNKPTVYIVSNKSFKDPWVKIGYTNKLTRRLSELNTSVPIDFEVEGYETFISEKYARSAEKKMHRIFRHLRSPNSHELFMISPVQAVTMLEYIRSTMRT